MTGTAVISTPGVGVDYEKWIPIDASSEAVFEAITTVKGLASWWTTRVEGSAVAGGELRFRFNGPESCDMHVGAAERPTLVRWHASACPFLPDWVGTMPTFTITPTPAGSELHFRHYGLIAQLECFEQCRDGWDYFLPSLKSYVESGRGRPFTLANQET